MTNRDDSEQLAWDFDAPESDGSSAAVVADEGLASLTPGSERWIAALQPTDADAMRLDEIQGYLCAALSGPQAIPEDDWLADVLGSDFVAQSVWVDGASRFPQALHWPPH